MSHPCFINLLFLLCLSLTQSYGAASKAVGLHVLCDEEVICVLGLPGEEDLAAGVAAADLATNWMLVTELMLEKTYCMVCHSL